RKTLSTRENVAAFEAGFVDRIRQLPGLAAAGVGSRPLGGGGAGVRITVPPGTRPVMVSVNVVSPGYLDALQMPLLQGRFVNGADSASAPFVVLVNASAGRTLWGGANPIGRTIASDGRTYE